jgi:hypothetical protein
MNINETKLSGKDFLESENQQVLEKILKLDKNFDIETFNLAQKVVSARKKRMNM